MSFYCSDRSPAGSYKKPRANAADQFSFRESEAHGTNPFGTSVLPPGTYGAANAGFTSSYMQSPGLTGLPQASVSGYSQVEPFGTYEHGHGFNGQSTRGNWDADNSDGEETWKAEHEGRFEGSKKPRNFHDHQRQKAPTQVISLARSLSQLRRRINPGHDASLQPLKQDASRPSMYPPNTGRETPLAGPPAEEMYWIDCTISECRRLMEDVRPDFKHFILEPCSLGQTHSEQRERDLEGKLHHAKGFFDRATDTCCTKVRTAQWKDNAEYHRTLEAQRELGEMTRELGQMSRSFFGENLNDPPSDLSLILSIFEHEIMKPVRTESRDKGSAAKPDDQTESYLGSDGDSNSHAENGVEAPWDENSRPGKDGEETASSSLYSVDADDTNETSENVTDQQVVSHTPQKHQDQDDGWASCTDRDTPEKSNTKSSKSKKPSTNKAKMSAASKSKTSMISKAVNPTLQSKDAIWFPAAVDRLFSSQPQRDPKEKLSRWDETVFTDCVDDTTVLVRRYRQQEDLSPQIGSSPFRDEIRRLRLDICYSLGRLCYAQLRWNRTQGDAPADGVDPSGGLQEMYMELRERYHVLRANMSSVPAEETWMIVTDGRVSC